jgi:hypothetical protein
VALLQQSEEQADLGGFGLGVRRLGANRKHQPRQR